MSSEKRTLTRPLKINYRRFFFFFDLFAQDGCCHFFFLGFLSVCWVSIMSLFFDRSSFSSSFSQSKFQIKTGHEKHFLEISTAFDVKQNCWFHRWFKRFHERINISNYSRFFLFSSSCFFCLRKTRISH